MNSINNGNIVIDELQDKQACPPDRRELKLQKFMKLLHREPGKDEVKTSQLSDELHYLPISRVEMLLDELFFGLWELNDFEYHQLGKDITAQLSLRVFHPVARVWLNRVGVASIALNHNTEKETEPTDTEEAHHTSGNLLSHLKAECLKNAARSLGKALGRDLNRDYSSRYKPIVPASPVGGPAE